ncbi:MAG TPA: hypothetical protein VGV37_29930, partial [Aliidongia sp.]|uniref:hypothetical protein n=1 Tax=Aliidongia sp. TaxID=1914230 RepID=UPI002DDCE9A6
MDGIEIFRTGQHTAVNGTTITVTPEILAGMAASYDRSVHEAPMVVGHPKSNAPAYGWVSGLIVDGDRLIAAPDQVDAEFEEMVRTGRFKKRSPSFYLPDNPSNPKPGTYYLRHVGFLGAQPPAVKGLKDIAFAEDPDALEFADWDPLAQVQLMRNLRDFLIGQFGQDKADQVLPSDLLDQLQFSAAQPCPDPDPDPIIPNFGEKPDMATAEELAERERLLTERETKLAKDGVTLRR